MSYGATDSAASPPNTFLSRAADTGRESDDHLQRRSTGAWQKLRNFYDRNFGLCLVFLAQTCSSIMNTAAKLLATEYEVKFHAMQIIFVRMLCTTILGMLYMWYRNVPDFPLGHRSIRGLLVLRGAAGFTGIFGLYYSLSWLEISDATVITFLIPTMTAIVCFIWLKEPFTSREALASLIALTGVMFVARPAWLFPGAPVDPISGEPGDDAANGMLTFIADVPRASAPPTAVSPSQRTLAVLVAIMGTVGASLAYATIRVIGKRSHSLISVNYFAAIAMIGSAAVLLVHPDLHFVMPQTLEQWGLVAIIGLTGFLLQFLLTEGLQREKAGRATNLLYLQLVFTLVIERVIWGTTPPMESLIGAALIITASIWVSLQKSEKPAEKETACVDEESSLMGRREE